MALLFDRWHGSLEKTGLIKMANGVFSVNALQEAGRILLAAVQASHGHAKTLSPRLRENIELPLVVHRCKSGLER